LIKLKGLENYEMWAGVITSYLDAYDSLDAIYTPPQPKQETAGLSEEAKTKLTEILLYKEDGKNKQSESAFIQVEKTAYKQSWLLAPSNKDDPYSHHSKNANARLAIVSTLQPSMYDTIKGYRSAYIIWHRLADRCREAPELQRSTLIRKFFAAKPSDHSNDLEKYAAEIDKIYRQL